MDEPCWTWSSRLKLRTQHGDVASFHTAIEVRYVYTNNVHIVYVPQLGMKQDEAYMVTLW